MPPNLRTLAAKCRGGMTSLRRFSSSTASNAPEFKTLLLAEIKSPNLFTCAALMAVTPLGNSFNSMNIAARCGEIW